MWADFRLQRSCDPCIFFNKVFYGTLRDALPLHGQEKGMLMAGKRFDFFTLSKVICHGRCDFGRKIQDYLVAALAGDKESIVFKIHILQIDTNTFRNADTGS